MTLGGHMAVEHLAVGGFDLTGFTAINVHDVVGPVIKYWGDGFKPIGVEHYLVIGHPV